ncbi:unnamed protein product [Rotaria sp. Silwood2]|nr:unnamed protein product [Rotaria sp. Silwood2]CAF2629413.1 unnamed protein product [Rotaria sp. Silwood2]CAF2879787.1 unnamed protein product [Rotaria sp. Silwood2]CAF3068357.1 unnamed protein product [Rotaria sp. Silwood2]CAF3877765.1 unnamed protein product [Rotaria sp. Silwood2]
MQESFIETTSITSYWQFLRMINWYEPWLIALCGFHAICLLIIILTRGHLNIQIFIFLGLLSCIYCAEYINKLAAENWQRFAEDQYFDSRGMFISTVLSLPVIINCCILVGIWLYESIVLLKICIKRMKKKRTEQNNDTDKDKKKKKE